MAFVCDAICPFCDETITWESGVIVCSQKGQIASQKGFRAPSYPYMNIISSKSVKLDLRFPILR
jgi:hypothetical protein